MTIVMIFLTGCDALLDCLDGDGPVFNTTALEPAVLNQEYEQTIRASVENEIRDDRFDYDFTLTTGSIPDGVSTRTSGRSFILSGTPIELGNFQFNLNVEIDDGLSATESGLCYRVRDQEFTLDVVQENG